MRLRIHTYPDPVLRRCGAPVPAIDDRIRTLVQDMIETMNADEGLGLAAPQVGESLRLFVLRDQQDPEKVYAVINPSLELAGEMLVDEEGCLSVPGKRAEVKRWAKATLRFTDVDGKECVLAGEGYFARAMQHEYDHLEGIVFVDRLPEKKRAEVLARDNATREDVQKLRRRT
ncbi:MAG TPA: peptide deformylase [bacterium]|nr:peptide deformylase [bacterium]